MQGSEWAAEVAQVLWQAAGRGAGRVWRRWLGWRAHWRTRFVSGAPGSPAEAGEVELQSVQLTNADSAAGDSE